MHDTGGMVAECLSVTHTRNYYAHVQYRYDTGILPIPVLCCFSPQFTFIFACLLCRDSSPQACFFSQLKKSGGVRHWHVCEDGRVWSNSRFCLCFFLRMAGVMAKGWSLACGTRWIRTLFFLCVKFHFVLWNCSFNFLNAYFAFLFLKMCKGLGFENQRIWIEMCKFENLRTTHRYKHHKEAWKAMVRRAMEKVLFFLFLFLFLLFSNTTRRPGKLRASS